MNALTSNHVAVALRRFLGLRAFLWGRRLSEVGKWLYGPPGMASAPQTATNGHEQKSVYVFAGNGLREVR